MEMSLTDVCFDPLFFLIRKEYFWRCAEPNCWTSGGKSDQKKDFHFYCKRCELYGLQRKTKKEAENKQTKNLSKKAEYGNAVLFLEPAYSFISLERYSQNPVPETTLALRNARPRRHR